MRIRKDDIVQVIAGDDKGIRAKVLRAFPEREKIVVEGVNRVYKHLKPGAHGRQGGRLSKEMPIHVSNVLLVCLHCDRGVRFGKRYISGGQKERFCKVCYGGLGKLGPPKPKRDLTIQVRSRQAGTVELSGGYGYGNRDRHGNGTSVFVPDTGVVMPKTDFDQLRDRYPALKSTLIELEKWIERHPHSPIDGRELLAKHPDLRPSELSFALSVLVENGLLQREFSIRDPTDRELIGKRFNSRKEIPSQLRDNKNRPFSSKEGEVVTLYRENSR